MGATTILDIPIARPCHPYTLRHGPLDAALDIALGSIVVTVSERGLRSGCRACRGSRSQQAVHAQHGVSWGRS